MTHLAGILLAGILLAGCATTEKQVELREVPIPIKSPCVTAEQVPRVTFATDAELDQLDDGNLVLALAKDRIERQVHIARLEAVLQGCTRRD